MDEIYALEKGYKWFVKTTEFGFALFLKNSDCCGLTSYTGWYDYHWTYDTYQEAKLDGIRLAIED